MIKNQSLGPEVVRLRNEVATISNNLSGIDFSNENNIVINNNQVVVGTIGVVPPQDDNPTPTFITDETIYTDNISCQELNASSAHITELFVDRFISGVNITGCRGPPGYATNTGATGPSGPERLIDLIDCPHQYVDNCFLTTTPTGLTFSPILKNDVCKLTPRVDENACQIKQNKDGFWGHFLLGSKQLTFMFQKQKLVLYTFCSHPTILKLQCLPFQDNSKCIYMDIHIQDGYNKTEVMVSPERYDDDVFLYQGVLTSNPEQEVYVFMVL